MFDLCMSELRRAALFVLRAMAVAGGAAGLLCLILLAHAVFS
jgi:hypothetical protein